MAIWTAKHAQEMLNRAKAGSRFGFDHPAHVEDWWRNTWADYRVCLYIITEAPPAETAEREYYVKIASALTDLLDTFCLGMFGWGFLSNGEPVEMLERDVGFELVQWLRYTKQICSDTAAFAQCVLVKPDGHMHQFVAGEMTDQMASGMIEHLKTEAHALIEVIPRPPSEEDETLH